MLNLKSKKIKIFMKNGFVFRGKVLNQDSKFIEIFDEVKDQERIIAVSEISNFEVLDNGRD